MCSHSISDHSGLIGTFVLGFGKSMLLDFSTFKFFICLWSPASYVVILADLDLNSFSAKPFLSVCLDNELSWHSQTRLTIARCVCILQRAPVSDVYLCSFSSAALCTSLISTCDIDPPRRGLFLAVSLHSSVLEDVIVPVPRVTKAWCAFMHDVNMATWIWYDKQESNVAASLLLFSKCFIFLNRLLLL